MLTHCSDAKFAHRLEEASAPEEARGGVLQSREFAGG